MGLHFLYYLFTMQYIHCLQYNTIAYNTTYATNNTNAYITHRLILSRKYDY